MQGGGGGGGGWSSENIIRNLGINAFFLGLYFVLSGDGEQWRLFTAGAWQPLDVTCPKI